MAPSCERNAQTASIARDSPAENNSTGSEMQGLRVHSAPLEEGSPVA
jgi:hypothetical protein